MDKLQRTEAKEVLKSIMKIDRHNFKQKMMTLVMFASGLTANGSNLFTPDDFEHLPGIETPIAVAKNLADRNELKKYREGLTQEDVEKLGLKDFTKAGSDNLAHELAATENAELGIRAAVWSYSFGLIKEGKDIPTKIFLSTAAGRAAEKEFNAAKNQYSINKIKKGKVAAGLIFANRLLRHLPKTMLEKTKSGQKALKQINKANQEYRKNVKDKGKIEASYVYARDYHKAVSKLLVNLAKENIVNHDTAKDIIKESGKDISNNWKGILVGLKIYFKHKLHNVKNFFLGKSTADLDIKHEAQEYWRYLDTPSNTIGTKDNNLAQILKSYDLQKAKENQAAVSLAQGVLRPRHNVDAAFTALTEKMRRRRGFDDPKVTVANNSEKFDLEGRKPPKSEDMNATTAQLNLPKGWALLAKDEERS